MDYNLWMFPHLWNRNFLPDDYNIPPTIYSLLNSYVNFENPNPVAIKNLASVGRGMIFDFDYPLADGITNEQFECMILNHFMMRRIGYETLTAFKLALNVKLNEIMPMYIKLFHAIDGWEIFKDGEVTSRTVNDSRTTTGTNGTETSNGITNTINGSSTSDRRFSDTPQNALADVRSGQYVSNYNYDTNTDTSTSNSTQNTTTNNTTSTNDAGNLVENITRSPADKMNNYVQFIKEKQNIYTMIFKDLDSLFYQIV